MRNFLAFLIVECDDFFLNGDLETQRQCYAIFQNKQKNNKKQIAKLFLRKLLKIYEHSTKPKTCFFYKINEPLIDKLYKISSENNNSLLIKGVCGEQMQPNDGEDFLLNDDNQTLLYKIKLNDFDFELKAYYYDFEYCEYVEFFSFKKEY